MEPAFSEEAFARSVSGLALYQQLLVGACVSERLVHSYRDFTREAGWGDISVIERTLDVVWHACLGHKTSAAATAALVEQCEAATPDTERFTTPSATLAQDAVFAICSLVDFMVEPELLSLVNACRYATDSLDLFIQDHEPSKLKGAALEAKILQHPLMQRELQRMARDLADARNIGEGDAQAVAAMRMRAQGERLFT